MSQKGDSKWIFDCGATDTMSFDPNHFISIKNSKNSLIQTANGECVEVRGAGTINILLNIELHNCLFVPNLSHKLFSIS